MSFSLFKIAIKILVVVLVSSQVWASPFIPAGNDFRLFGLGSRYGILFDNAGNPVVVFDYSLSPVGWKDYALGKWSAHEYTKLQFNDYRIQSEVRSRQKDGSTSEFQPAFFTLADIYLEKKDQERVYEVMNRFSLLVLKSILKKEDLKKFMTQFELRWDKQKKEFNLVWNPSQDVHLKDSMVPGWLVNYRDPLDIQTYKNRLRGLVEDVSKLELTTKNYGGGLSTFISRVAIGLVSRLNLHQNQLIDKLEEALREKSQGSMPLNNFEDFFTETISITSKSRDKTEVDYEGDVLIDSAVSGSLENSSDVFGIPKRFESATMKINQQLAKSLAASGVKDFHYVNAISDLLDNANLDYTH